MVDIFRRRVLWVLLCVALGAGAAYAVTKNQIKGYKATASLVFASNQVGQQAAGLPATAGESQQAQQSTNVKLVRFGDIAAKTAAQLGQGLTKETVSEGLSISTAGESNVVQVSDTATTPALAAEIANTYAEQFVSEQQSDSHVAYTAALTRVDRQLAALPAKERTGAAGSALRERAQSLRTLEELNSGSVQVAQAATAPTSASSPKVLRNTLLGALVGLFLGLGLVLLFAALDQRIRDPRELAAIYGLPLLGVVPQSRALARSARNRKSSKKALPAREAEAFQLVRAHVRSFNVDVELGTLLVVSAAPGDGKTTVARQFATAAARRGLRVLLLEADLRHPTLAKQLDVQPGPGVSDVLGGAMSLSEVTQLLELESASKEGSEQRTLDVAVAGAALPPNPGELIESPAMGVLLEQARSTYDLVVVDTPPLIPVSDAFPLLSRVDGVVIVGRVGRNRRDVVERLHEILMGAGAPLLGVVANGFKAGRRGSYDYSYDYAPAPVVRPPSAEMSMNGASANGASPAAQPAPSEPVPAQSVPAQPASSTSPTYGEAVDLHGLLGELSQPPSRRESRRARRRRESGSSR